MDTSKTADKTTGEASTPEEIAAQEAEQKNQNQEEAFKRITEENKKLKEDAKAKKEGKSSTEEKPKTETPDVRELIREELTAKTEMETKVGEALTKYPELKEHESKIREYLNDDSRKNIPIDEVVAGAVGMEKLLQMGAAMGAERTRATVESSAGGDGAKVTTQTEEEKTEAQHMESLPDEFK